MRAAHVFTYTLGKSLYIPLTSRCNSLTLPQTRGVNFALPNSVIASLLNVRQAEIQHSDDVVANINEFPHLQFDGKSLLPPKDDSSWKNDSVGGFDSILHETTIPEFPSTNVLFKEVKHHLELSNGDIEEIVFAGEGEPTLRLKTLETLASKIYQYMKQYNTKEMDNTIIPMRIITNGLVLCKNREGKDILHRLLSSGVRTLSIALMTSSPEQYDKLMQPFIGMKCSHQDTHIHTLLCQLVQNAVRVGFNVELTGVDHKYIDKRLASDLAVTLGASSFRFRPYLP
jgi:hypothetical protein